MVVKKPLFSALFESTLDKYHEGLAHYSDHAYLHMKKREDICYNSHDFILLLTKNDQF